MANIVHLLFSTLKYTMFFVNFLFVLTGIVILSVGISVQVQYSYYELLLDNAFFSIPTFLIAIGILIFLISFVGCCGAIRENYYMNLTFAILMIAIFILEFSAGISGYVLRNRTTVLLQKSLVDTMLLYRQNGSLEVTILWDEIQRDFECCGVTAPGEWERILNGSIPVSCCAVEPGALELLCNSTISYQTGCAVKFGSWVEEHAVVLGGVGFGICIFQALAIVSSCYLARKSKFEQL